MDNTIFDLLEQSNELINRLSIIELEERLETVAEDPRCCVRCYGNYEISEI